MKVKKFLKAILLSVIVSMLLAGCGARDSGPKKTQSSAAQNEVLLDLELAEKVRKSALTVRGVRESAAVVINDEISVAVKVSGFDRLRLNPIRGEVHKKTKELGKDYKVHVTSDKKLFTELQKIEGQIKDGTQSPADIQKKLKEINENMNG